MARGFNKKRRAVISDLSLADLQLASALRGLISKEIKRKTPAKHGMADQTTKLCASISQVLAEFSYVVVYWLSGPTR